MSAVGISYVVEDPAATIRLERPEKLNAFTFAMVEELRAAVGRAVADERVVGIVLTGSGRGFSAGLDSGDLERSATPRGLGASLYPEGELPALFSFLLRAPKPVIAAVNGVAAGGGMVLAMMCDLRFASETASFTTVFSKRGLIAEHLMASLLPRLVGPNRALDLLWSSRRIDAAEAFRMGFVDRVLPAEQLLEEAHAYVRELAASVSPRSLAVIKAQVYADLSRSVTDAAEDADRRMREAVRHPDAKEGVTALLERRSPRFPRWKE